MESVEILDCRNLATQLWSRWFTPAKSSSNTGNEFMMGGSEPQGSMLSEDMDLLIYSPDTGSANSTIFNYTDSINMNLTEEMNVGMSMNNLTTLDMNSYAPYMENNDYYAMNSVEPLAINTNIIDNSMSNSIGHENYMQPNYSNETIDHEQSLLNATPAPMEAHPTPSWPVEPAAANPPSAVTTPVTTSSSSSSSSNNINSSSNNISSNSNSMNNSSTSSSNNNSNNNSSTEPVTGLPVLKIKVTKGGQPYVVNSSALLVPASDTKADPSGQPADAPGDDTKTKSTKDKNKDKDRKKDKDKDKKVSSKKEESSKKSSSSSSGGGSSSSDSKKRDKEKSSSRVKSSSLDKSEKQSKDKDRTKTKSKDDKNERRAKTQTEKETKQLKQAEKNRETLALLQARTASAVKMPKIPRKKPEEVEAMEAPPAAPSAPSTDVVEKLQPRPKTVKMFNSKFRSTGLEEPVRKPSGPPDTSKKTVMTGSLKRSAAFDAAIAPLDKKAKAIDDSAISAAVAAVMKKTAAETKPAIKLISPRPRRKLSFSSSTIIFYRFLQHYRSTYFHPPSRHTPKNVLKNTNKISKHFREHSFYLNMNHISHLGKMTENPYPREIFLAMFSREHLKAKDLLLLALRAHPLGNFPMKPSRNPIKFPNIFRMSQGIAQTCRNNLKIFVKKL